MDKQRLLKVVCCIALAVSVFLSSAGVGYADDSAEENDIASSEYWSGGFSVAGQPCMMLINANQNSLPESTAYTATYSGSTNISVSMTPVTYGCTYEGAAYFDLYFTRTYSDSTPSYGRLNALCTDVSAPDGINLSFRSIDVTSDDRYGIRVYVYIDDYYVGTKGNVYFSFVLTINQGLTTTSGGPLMTSYYYMLDKYTYEYAGTIYEKVVNSNSEVGAAYDIGQQQMEQQQQIADQQAQQSAQQHDDLVNGYDTSSDNTMLADKNATLQDFEAQQDQAISAGQQYVSDYSATYDTSVFDNMASSFVMVSGWFNDLWSGMRNFSSVLIVGLMLCVAGYILKLKH